MRRPAIAFIVLEVLLAPVTGLTQASLLVAARVHASVELDSRGEFVYKYTLENGPDSASIGKLGIDVSSPPASARDAGPLSLSAPPPGWHAAIGRDAMAHWEAIQNNAVVLPNKTVAGFSMTSHAPPALRRFTLTPQADAAHAPVMPPGDDPGDVDRYNQDLARYVDSESLKGMTLGPATLQAATPDAVLASLSNQIAQARSAGWISSDASARSVRAKIDAARATFSRGQSAAAQNDLTSLRNDVTAESGKSFTAEAVALVTMNIQYVLRLAARH